MSKDKKGIEIARQIPDVRKPEQRIEDFNEVSRGFSREKVILEANRCLQCKKPKCCEGCPAKIDILAFIKLITEGRFIEAGLKIKESNPLPQVCGRVCPQEIQCEKSCILGIKEQPVAIGAMERYLGDFLAQEDSQGLKTVVSLNILIQRYISFLVPEKQSSRHTYYPNVRILLRNRRLSVLTLSLFFSQGFQIPPFLFPLY